MPQVSKRFLRKEVEDRLFGVFYEILGEYKTESDTRTFFNSFLTPTEQVMLAKRMAIAIMLLNDYDYRSISDVLKVGYGTISRVANWLARAEDASVRVLRKHIESKSKAREIIKVLDKILYDATPPKRFGKRIKPPYKYPTHFPYDY